jgi:predicted Zn-dependent peptidase
LWPEEREGWGPNGNPAKRRKLTKNDVSKQWKETLSHPPLITGCGSSESVVQRAVDELVDTFPLYEQQESRLQHPQLATATTGDCVHVPFPGDAEALRFVHALPAASGRQRAIMELLNFALSGGFMGALYHSLRTELHLVYGVRAYPAYRSDDTLWVIETSPSPGRSREVLDALPHAIANLQARLRGVHFESLVDRFLAHHIHRRVTWRARYNAMRLDLEESRPARERARLPERVQKLGSDEVYDVLSRWTE